MPIQNDNLIDYMHKILWHCWETRQKTEKTNLVLSTRRKSVYSLFIVNRVKFYEQDASKIRIGNVGSDGCLVE